MPHIAPGQAPVFHRGGLRVTGLAAPSRGARETAVWRFVLEPGAPGAEHAVDREEVFVALRGRARLTLGSEVVDLEAGGAFVVPAGTTFSLANPHDEAFEAVAAMPVGARACLPGGAPFTPPWAE